MDKKLVNMERDDRWKAYPLLPGDFESFCSVVLGELYLNPDADLNVKDHWKVICRLLEFSYYEYEFFDVASNLAHNLLEMALRIWYTKQTAKSNKSKSLKELLTWASNENYLETDSEFYLEWLRKTRNFVTHRDSYWYQGAFMNANIAQSLDLINDLYEDVEKRIERKSQRKLYKVVFSTLAENGIQITCGNKVFKTAYHIQTAFIDNKVNPAKTTFIFNTPFKVPVFSPGDTVIIHPFEILELYNVEIEDSLSVKGKDIDGYPIRISSIEGEQQEKEFQEWKALYNSFNVASWYDHSSDRSRADYCSQLRAQFHRRLSE